MRAAPANSRSWQEVEGHIRYAQYTLCIALSLFLMANLSGCAAVRTTSPVVKIGLVAPFEGQYRYIGYDAINAARLALRLAGVTGGVGGYTVELVAYDDGGTIPGARRAARNLLLDPQVVAVIGHFRDSATEAARALYLQEGVLLVNAGTVEGGLGEHSDLLCSLLDFLRANEMLSSHRIQWFTTRETSLTCANASLITISTQMPPQPDVGAVLLTRDPVASGEAVLALREGGWDGLILGGPALGSPSFSQIADPSGVIFASPYRWPDYGLGDADFEAKYRSLGPHVPRPGPFALNTYQAVQALLAVIDSAGRNGADPTRQHLIQHANPSPSTEVFIYRWTLSLTLELVGQSTIARD